jgi:hypothetical protein
MNYYISLLSGLKYSLPEKMCENIDKYQIRLTALPKDKCKKCYGRGYTGYDNNLQIFVMCNCVKNHSHPDLTDITIETPRQTKQVEFI